MKKTLFISLLLLCKVFSYAQTWENLDSDHTGFLNVGHNNYPVYKTTGDGSHYVVTSHFNIWK
ncbi:MAG: hypothetical protein ACK4ND_11485 [Cytophagaceae bacterium]